MGIRELRENEKNNICLVDFYQLLVPDKKTKYVQMYPKFVKNHDLLIRQKRKLINELIETFDFFNREDLEQLDPIMVSILAHLITNVFKPESIAEVYRFCNYIEKNIIEKKDVQQYKTMDQVHRVVVDVDKKQELKALEKQVFKVYEDDEWMVIRPLTYEASKKYGANTKWCTTYTQDRQYFDKYTKYGMLFYSMNKKNNTKVATFYALCTESEANSISHVKYKEFSFWNADDTQASDSMSTPLSIEVLKVIKEETSNPAKVSNLQLGKDEKILDRNGEVKEASRTNRLSNVWSRIVDNNDTENHESDENLFYNQHNHNWGILSGVTQETDVTEDSNLDTFDQLLREHNIGPSRIDADFEEALRTLHDSIMSRTNVAPSANDN